MPASPDWVACQPAASNQALICCQRAPCVIWAPLQALAQESPEQWADGALKEWQALQLCAADNVLGITAATAPPAGTSGGATGGTGGHGRRAGSDGGDCHRGSLSGIDTM
jgi:hypothetical protein